MALDFQGADLFAAEGAPEGPSEGCLRGLSVPVRPRSPLAQRGLRNYLSGQAAEEAVARAYLAQGWQILARRWRCFGAEIDLIVAKAHNLAVVEVKSGPTHDQAAGHLTQGQIRGLIRAGEAYLFANWLPLLPKGAEPELRFDLALVDRMGRIDLCEAAFFA